MIDTDEILKKDPKKLKGKERDDWLTAKQKDIMKKVDSFKQSPEEIKELLTFMSKFHNYSYYNSMLIQSQWEGAYAVGSYKFWKDLGFPPKEQAKILIWVPVRYSMIHLPNGTRVLKSKATPDMLDKVKRKELKMTNHTGFKSGYVFEVSQTTATAEDLPKIFPNKFIDFEVDEEGYSTLLDGLDTLADHLGTEMFWDEHNELGSAKGAYFPTQHIIKLNPRLTRTGTLRTALHELAHAKMHRNVQMPSYQKELQAELVTGIVSNTYGLDTLDYTISYISSWMKKHNKEESLTEQLVEVQKVVKEFIQIIDGVKEQQTQVETNTTDS